MPYKRRYKPKSKRPRYFRRKRRYGRKNVSMMKMKSPIVGFPSVFHTKLRYSDTITLTLTSGANAAHTFAGNDTNDPDVTGTGHQPTYYDQIGNVYGSVRINSCKIRVTFQNASDVNCLCLLKASNGVPTIPTAITDEIEDYMTKWRTLSHSDAKGSTTLSMYRTLKNVVGRNFDRDRYVLHSLGQSPTDLWYYTIMAQPVDEASTATVRAVVQLTYYCTFYNRLGVSIS